MGSDHLAIVLDECGVIRSVVASANVLTAFTGDLSQKRIHETDAVQRAGARG